MMLNELFKLCSETANEHELLSRLVDILENDIDDPNLLYLDAGTLLIEAFRNGLVKQITEQGEKNANGISMSQQGNGKH